MDFHRSVLRAFCLADPVAKVNSVGSLDSSDMPQGYGVSHRPALKLSPGRPLQPELVDATRVPRRSPFTESGHAALIHSIVHIEFNAINLALDAILRFEGMPHQYYLDWLSVAKDEARHFTLLHKHLRALGYAYGDFPAHNGLWSMCEKTSDDIVARMALVPRTLEARGLDATPVIQARLRKVGTPQALQSVAILDIILADEVGHVAIGNQWYRWLCVRSGLDPVNHYAVVSCLYSAPRLKPPFNDAARRLAGFTDQELSLLGG
jgi:uncharacterized ferritin-like protein (DUF455 family)